MRRTKKNAANASTLAPKVMSLSQEDLKIRLDWIELEISQLSSLNGVTERLRALRYSQSRLLATQALTSIMYKFRGDSGIPLSQGDGE